MVGRLKKAIDKNNIVEARHIIREMLWWDVYPEIALKKVVDIANGANVFEKHDGRSLIMEKNQWTEDYLDILREKLLMNFSEERFVLAYEVAKKLKKGDTENYEAENKECSINGCEKRCCKIGKKVIKIGVMALGCLAIGLSIFKHNCNKN